MKDFKRILVPVDFGESSEQALDLAIGMADKFGASLVLAHAYELPVYPYDGAFLASADWVTAIQTAARQRLDATLSSVRERVPAATAVLREGSPTDQILAAAHDEKADLIVLGTHGRHGVGRVLLGSVAEKVARLSPIPVLIVRRTPST